MNSVNSVKMFITFHLWTLGEDSESTDVPLMLEVVAEVETGEDVQAVKADRPREDDVQAAGGAMRTR